MLSDLELAKIRANYPQCFNHHENRAIQIGLPAGFSVGLDTPCYGSEFFCVGSVVGGIRWDNGGHGSGDSTNYFNLEAYKPSIGDIVFLVDGKTTPSELYPILGSDHFCLGIVTAASIPSNIITVRFKQTTIQVPYNVLIPAFGYVDPVLEFSSALKSKSCWSN